MKLINSSFKILEQEPGLQGIYKQIELAGRTCYKTLDKITKDSAKGFVDRMIASQHYAMLEHGTVYLKFDFRAGGIATGAKDGTKYIGNPYSKVNFGDGITQYVTTNYRVLVENGWLNDLKYLCEPTEFHEKRVTVRFTTSNSIMREFTRHRSMSFAVESTRYCNYSRDRFNNELTFIQPFWVKEEMPPEEASKYVLFRGLLEYAETTYLEMIKSGMKPQEAREVLPLATKCDMIMTGFVSDYQHFFDLRARGTTGASHPDAKALAEPLMGEFYKRGYIK